MDDLDDLDHLVGLRASRKQQGLPRGFKPLRGRGGPHFGTQAERARLQTSENHQQCCRKPNASRFETRSRVVANYLSLAVMNVRFYFVYRYRDMTHLVDVLGLGALAIVVITFLAVHRRTGLWALTHAQAETLDERQLQITHDALSRAYGWFAVICLSIMLAHAVLFRLVP